MTYTQILDPMTGQVSDRMIRRDKDGAFIPFDEGNRDYREYQAWLAEGNQPNPPEPKPGSAPRVELTPPVDEEIKRYVDNQIADAIAQIKGE